MKHPKGTGVVKLPMVVVGRINYSLYFISDVLYWIRQLTGR